MPIFRVHNSGVAFHVVNREEAFQLSIHYDVEVSDRTRRHRTKAPIDSQIPGSGATTKSCLQLLRCHLDTDIHRISSNVGTRLLPSRTRL